MVNSRVLAKKQGISYYAVVQQILIALLDLHIRPNLTELSLSQGNGSLPDFFANCMTLILRFATLHLVSDSCRETGSEFPPGRFDALALQFWRRFQLDCQGAISPTETIDDSFLALLDDLVQLIRQSVETPEQSLSEIYEALLTMRPSLSNDEHGAVKIAITALDKVQRRRGSFYTPLSLVRQAVSIAITPLLYEQGQVRSPASIASLRILDPSMGTGAFLVETFRALVQALKHSLAGSGISEKEFLQELGSKCPTIFEHIARQCLYGVDIDPVAVEVARLRLWLLSGGSWLDQFESFPNLRVGNSLVGARIENVFPPHRIDGKMAGGADDDAVRQRLRPVQSGEAAGRNLLAAAQSPHDRKELLDLWCSRWFMEPDNRIESFINSMLLKSGESLLPEWLKQTVFETAGRNKFFHWQIEFEHVFRDGGFDLVIGNPPWEIEKPNSREFFGLIDSTFWSLGKQEAMIRQAELFMRHSELCEQWEQRLKDHAYLLNWVKKSPVQFGSACVPFSHQGRGDANLYKLFIEQSYYLTRDGGMVALLVPSGLYSDCGTKELRKLLLEQCGWHTLLGFYNTDGAFDIHRSFRYCFFVATKGGTTAEVDACFLNTSSEMHCREVAPLAVTSIREDEPDDTYDKKSLVPNRPARTSSEKCSAYSADMISKASPKWSSIPEVETIAEHRLLEQIYDSAAYLGDTVIGDARLGYSREFDMTLDSRYFYLRDKVEARGLVQDGFGNWLSGNWSAVDSTTTDEGVILSACGGKRVLIEDVSEVLVPVYEGRMIGQFDANAKHWQSGKGRRAIWQAPDCQELGPQYLVDRRVFLENSVVDKLKVGFLAVGSPTNVRTMISACLSNVACGNSVPVFYFSKSEETLPRAKESSCGLAGDELSLVLSGILNSFVFDFVLRRKMSGNNLNYYILEECPVPRFEMTDGEVWKALARLVAMLSLQSARFALPLVRMGYPRQPSITDSMRTICRASIDALAAYLYRLSPADFRVVLFGGVVDGESGDVRAVSPKGFWRVDKALPRGERGPFRAIERLERLYEIGIERFLQELPVLPDNNLGSVELVSSAESLRQLLFGE